MHPGRPAAQHWRSVDGRQQLRVLAELHMLSVERVVRRQDSDTGVEPRLERAAAEPLAGDNLAEGEELGCELVDETHVGRGQAPSDVVPPERVLPRQTAEDHRVVARRHVVHDCDQPPVLLLALGLGLVEVLNALDLFLVQREQNHLREPDHRHRRGQRRCVPQPRPLRPRRHDLFVPAR